MRRSSTPSPPARRRALRLATAAAALLVAWLLVAEIAVPELLRILHRGEGPELLVRLLAGREEHGVGRYLAAWDGVARHVSAVAAPALALAVGGLVLFGGRPVEGTEPAAGRPPGTLRILGVSLWAGLAVGVGEAYYVGVKAFYLRELVPDFFAVSEASLWMIPLADAGAFALLGAAVAAGGRALGRRPALADVAGILAFAGACVLLLRPGRVHPAAAVVLAAGLGVQARRLAGRRPAPFRRLVRASTPVLLLLVLAAAAGSHLASRPGRAEGGPGPAAGASAPSVLLLILDTVRADHLTPYGYERDTSPFLEELAGRGVVFEQAFATSPFTLPSHAAMLTGRYAYEHGLAVDAPMDPRFPTLAEELSAGGYATGAVVANLPFCNDWYGFGRGFHVYDDHAVTLRRFLRSAWLTRRASERIRPLLGERGHHVKRSAPEVTRRFLEWLDEDVAGQGPFFAMLNFMDAHAPYRPPEHHRRRFSAPSDRYWWRGAMFDPDRRPTEEELRELEATYDESIAYLDGALRRLFRELGRRGALEHTLVVVTSDHGEQFGEHGLGNHANSLYRQVLHVPLIVVPPGGARPSRRVSTPVSLRDLPATILDAAGRPVPAGLPGRSLAPAWTPGGGDGAGLAEGPVVSEHGRNRSVILGRWHLIVRRSGEAELYDLRADPAESRELSATPEGRRKARELYRLLAPYDPPEIPARASSASR